MNKNLSWPQAYQSTKRFSTSTVATQKRASRNAHLTNSHSNSSLTVLWQWTRFRTQSRRTLKWSAVNTGMIVWQNLSTKISWKKLTAMSLWMSKPSLKSNWSICYHLTSYFPPQWSCSWWSKTIQLTLRNFITGKIWLYWRPLWSSWLLRLDLVGLSNNGQSESCCLGMLIHSWKGWKRLTPWWAVTQVSIRSLCWATQTSHKNKLTYSRRQFIQGTQTFKRCGSMHHCTEKGTSLTTKHGSTVTTSRVSSWVLTVFLFQSTAQTRCKTRPTLIKKALFTVSSLPCTGLLSWTFPSMTKCSVWIC